MSNTDLAKALFAAFAAGDADAARAVCSAELRGSQNGGPAMDLAAILHFAVAVKRAAPDFRYDDAIRTATDTGFVEEHRVRATFKDGSVLDLMVCVIAEIEDGKITALREYFDTARAAALGQALAAG